MGKQRHRSRRRFLRAAGLAGFAGIAGCSGSAGDEPVSILAAGSLQNALTTGLEPTVDVAIQVETHGSATVARLVAEGQRDPDIVTVADVALFDRPLSPAWHTVFASNAVVVAYNNETDGGRAVAAADRWYEPMLDGTATVGRTDPNQDPLGYRTLFAIELAARYYDVGDLGDRLLRRDQLYPETGLLSRFETGAIDAAFAYRNMAVERGYEYVELPDRIDLSEPGHVEDWYATVSYTLPSGQTVRGGLIRYGSTVRHVSDDTLAVFDAQTTGGYLADHGFVLRDQFPAHVGEVPAGVDRTATRAHGG